jgi:hypothetical protein
MAKSGKNLEKLVRRIESYLLPIGFNVNSNDRIYNDEGVQVAEFDVEITGKLGSTDIKWLIECRDCPSDGPAPGSWIEQLVGRRDRFQFNKVTAVSTTGFSPGALKYAQESGIETRLVNSITVEDIWNWFRISELTYLDDHAHLHDVKLYFSDQLTSTEIQSIKKLLDKLTLNTPAFYSVKIGQIFTALSMFQLLLQKHPEVFSSAKSNPEGILYKFKVKLPTGENGFQINTENGTHQVLGIDFTAELTRNVHTFPIDSLFEYRATNKGGVIAQTARFQVDIKNERYEIDFEKINYTYELKISIERKE